MRSPVNLITAAPISGRLGWRSAEWAIRRKGDGTMDDLRREAL
jgi:hypothetical protein